jgi:glycosyltransferase involved in cell wall biosynthesis
MNTPTVSVIVPSYNRADLLAEALASVIDQTFQDFEIVIVDDGSEDHSLEVIESFRRKDPGRIHLHLHPGHANLGIQESHRLGIEKARGRILAFLDNDDRWTPNYLQAKVDILDSRPEVGVVFSPYRVVGEKLFGLDMMLRQWLLRPTIRKGRPFDNFGNLLQFNNVASFSCFVTRSELLADLPPLSRESLLFDWWVLLWLSTRTQFFCDDASLTYWRWSRESTMGQQHFHQLRQQTCDFMTLAYDRLEEVDHGPVESHAEIFGRYRRIAPLFLAYYRRPGFGKLARFMMRSPYWALASTLSLVINYTKFR